MKPYTPLPWWNESGVIHAANGTGGATHPAHFEEEDDAEYAMWILNLHPRLVEMLRSLQWGCSDTQYPESRCPSCEAWGKRNIDEGGNHESDCALAALLMECAT